MSDSSSNPNLEYLEHRWRRNPGSRIYLQLAEEYRRLERHSDAVDVLTRGLADRPQDLSGLVVLGRCQLELDQFDDAASSLEKVLARDPAHMVANKLMVDAQLQRGDAERAEERLSFYRLLNDRDPEIDHFEYRLAQLRDDAAPAPVAQPAAAETNEAAGESADVASAGSPPEVAAPPSADDQGDIFALETLPSAPIELDLPRATAAPKPTVARNNGLPFGDLPAVNGIEHWLVLAQGGLFSETEVVPLGGAVPSPQAAPQASADDAAGVDAGAPEAPSERAVEEAAPADELITDGEDDPFSFDTPDTLESSSVAEDVVEDLGDAEDSTLGAAAALAGAAVAGLGAVAVAEATEPADSDVAPDVADDVATPEPVAASEPQPASTPVDETEESVDAVPTTVAMGDLYLEQGHPREAEQIFRRVLETDADNARARAGLARVAEIDSALQRVTGSVEPEPDPEPPVLSPEVAELEALAAPEAETEQDDTAPASEVDAVEAGLDAADLSQLVAGETLPEGITARKIFALQRYLSLIQQGRDHVS